MTIPRLIIRNLTYYWRTNAAVILGVATAVAVLSGALLVGDSVRGSLRALVLARLGRTDQVIVSGGFFREQLAGDIANDPNFSTRGIAPMILAQGFVSMQGGGGRAGKVSIYGVDDRFWKFHGVSLEAPTGRDALLSPALAMELGTVVGNTILVRLQRPSDIPLESLHGRKEDATQTIRASVRAILARESLGDFSLQAQQGAVRAVFLPLSLLQRDLGVDAKVNALLISGAGEIPALEKLVRDHTTLEDLGLKLRVLKSGVVALESAGGVIEDTPANATLALAGDAGVKVQPLFTYLANTLRVGSREVPYSLVTAIDAPESNVGTSPPIVLNDWAARDLNAKPGDTLSMEYFAWEEPGELVTRTAEFRVDRIVPLTAGDGEMAPVFPGITDAAALNDWNPPFPINLRRVRPVDEDYWKKYKTTPKAFIPLQVGQDLWKTRYGAMTSIRLFPPVGKSPETLLTEVTQRLRERLDPLRAGIAVQDVRAQSLDASRGATNFGEYFVYFSFFLVLSALLLAALFFKLSVEQRIREVGLLRAVGLPPGVVRRIFLGEGLCLSLAGALLGAAGGVLYAAAIVAALRTWWIGAVGTGEVALHVSWLSVAFGAVGGIVAALICIGWTLRSLRHISERGLLAGQLESGSHSSTDSQSSSRVAWAVAVAGTLLLIAGTAGVVDRAAAFFGSGLLLLVAALFYFRYQLSRPAHGTIGIGRSSLSHLGFRNASFRPTRSVVAMATIASATFILIAVDSFRKGEPEMGVGGYDVLVETLVPIAQDPNSKAGRDLLGLNDFEGIRFEPFRVRPGDDASCLNLYEPRNPRILSAPDTFLNAGRFSFQSSVPAENSATQKNPWLLLHKMEPDGAIPVIADANSMTYVLHRKLGEDFVITNRGQEIRLRFVGALSDSIFQSELLMSQENFVRLFPEQQGFSFFLVEGSNESADAAAMKIENILADYGADATSTAARLAEFHRVENTYLSTFQMLGALGLLLGTVGLAAVLLRSILERRRELALLRTLGYEPRHFLAMTIMENALLLGGGLMTGTVCAIVAIAPAALAEGGRFPGFALAILLGVILAVGLLVSLLATRVALREAVLPALRSE
jgi:putative ABC transport system permease protein